MNRPSFMKFVTNLVMPIARVLLGVMCLGLLVGVSHAQQAPAPKRVTLAVLDLDAVGAGKAEVTALSERLREMLLKSGQFTMVDRSQMEKILDEQAFQQAGCSGNNCVVRVGRILGVQKIVTGKAVQAGDGMWLLSAQMVNVETAETLSLESLRHRGTLFDLLESGVPILARRLLGEKVLPVATASAMISNVPTASSPDAAPRKRMKLAVFPGRLSGQGRNRLFKLTPKLLLSIHKVGKMSPARVAMTHTYYGTGSEKLSRAHRRFKKHPLYGRLAGWAKRGRLINPPSINNLQKAGKALGVDLIFLYSSHWDKADAKSYSAYLFDVRGLKLYHRSGSFLGGGDWIREMTRSFKSMVKEQMADFPGRSADQ